MSEVAINYKGINIANMNASGTKTLLTEGKYCEDDIEVVYTRPSGGSPVLQTKTKTYTPTTSQQSESVTADNGYDGLETVSVTVNAISPVRTSSDLTASGATVTVPNGWYASQATKSVASGTAGTPTATKGTVSNHSISVTPSVTNTAGYIAGGTETGTAVSVSASELVSGNRAITQNGTGIDVTNYSTVSVSVSSKNAQVVQQAANRISSTSYTQASGVITVAKSGTYDVYWTAYRTSTSGTWGTQLYINSSEYGDAQTSFDSYYQKVQLSGVSLTANQRVMVYGRSRGSNYYLYVGQLTIIES